MDRIQTFPKHLLDIIRKHRVTNGTLAAVLKIDRTTVSKKLGSKRPISFHEIRDIILFFKKVKGIEIDADKVFKIEK